MRNVGFIALGLVAIACGPDPNARLPGSPTVINNGGTVSSAGGGGSGGQGAGGVGAGGTTQSNGGSSGSGGKDQPASGGAAGSSPFDTGGSGSGGVKVGSGGAAGSSPFDTGGAAGKGSGGKGGGGGVGSGGVSSGGGTTSKGGSGGGGSSSSGWGVGPEPCSPAKDFSCSTGSGSTGNFDATTFCFRTADKIAGWSCNNMDGWTMTINGKEVACTSGTVTSSTLPPAIDGIYYFQFTSSASAKPWASLSWYANTGDCKAGPYPAWGSGGSSSADGGA